MLKTRTLITCSRRILAFTQPVNYSHCMKIGQLIIKLINMLLKHNLKCKLYDIHPIAEMFDYVNS
jgi:hypothetical protein